MGDRDIVRVGRAMCGVDEDGIYVVRVDEDIDVAVRDVSMWIEDQLARVPGAVPVLIDATRLRSMSRAAQEVTVDRRLIGRSACVAILTASPVSVVVANFFLIFARPPYPAKLFSDEAKARAWCLEVGRPR
jgi:hypothetical protein